VRPATVPIAMMSAMATIATTAFEFFIGDSLARARRVVSISAG
jgi:hypothetical protein